MVLIDGKGKPRLPPVTTTTTTTTTATATRTEADAPPQGPRVDDDALESAPGHAMPPQSTPNRSDAVQRVLGARAGALEPTLSPTAMLRATARLMAAHPQAARTLEAGGVHPERTTSIANPYAAGATDKEDFTNVGRHCVAVAVGAEALANALVAAGKLAPDAGAHVVERALVHDASKRFEVLRKQAAKRDGDAYRPAAYEALGALLAAQGTSSELAAYLATAGQETGHVSLQSFIALDDNGAVMLHPERTLAEHIVHIVDDMTFSPRESPLIAVFKPVAERMEASNFRKAYPFLYREGLGFDAAGAVVRVDDVTAPPADLRHVQSYAAWQVDVAERVATHLARACTTDDVEPQAFLLDHIRARCG
jgi:hypothetical protein